MSGVVLRLSRYKCFMENKKIIIFCGCKPSQKTTLSLIKSLLVLVKRYCYELQDTSEDTSEYRKVKR